MDGVPRLFLAPCHEAYAQASKLPRTVLLTLVTSSFLRLLGYLISSSQGGAG